MSLCFGFQPQHLRQPVQSADHRFAGEHAIGLGKAEDEPAGRDGKFGACEQLRRAGGEGVGKAQRDTERFGATGCVHVQQASGRGEEGGIRWRFVPQCHGKG